VRQLIVLCVALLAGACGESAIDSARTAATTSSLATTTPLAATTSTPAATRLSPLEGRAVRACEDTGDSACVEKVVAFAAQPPRGSIIVVCDWSDGTVQVLPVPAPDQGASVCHQARSVVDPEMSSTEFAVP
jgi:hypothetical protein